LREAVCGYVATGAFAPGYLIAKRRIVSLPNQSRSVRWTGHGNDSHRPVGQLVLFDSRNASYHALNQSASAIWRQLGASGDLATVTAAIAADYGLADGEADEAVQAFVGGALAKGLLVAD
jgi:Coenzyme PQQ synthesis protein D (PqqD)